MLTNSCLLHSIYCLVVIVLSSLFSYGQPVQGKPESVQRRSLEQKPLGRTPDTPVLKEADVDLKVWQQAKEIASRIIIIDCHNHSLFSSLSPQENIGKQTTYSSLNSGGVKGMVQSFPIKRDTSGTISENILSDIRSVKAEMRNSSLHASVIQKSDDIIPVIRKGDVAILIGVESFKGLSEGKLDLLQKYYDQDVRLIGFHKSGWDTVSQNDNLTKYGVDYIKELNRLGIICDITHVGEKIQGAVIDQSEAPVIISHSGVFNMVKSGFNVSNSILTKLTGKQGIMCVTFYSGQLSNESLSQLSNRTAWTHISRARIEELIDQIDYLKEKVGIDYIGIGSDYGGSGRMAPKGLETIDGFPLIIYHMLIRGYSEVEIEKVMVVNFIRFYERVEATASLKKK